MGLLDSLKKGANWFTSNLKEDIQNVKNLPVAAWLAPLAPVAASVPAVGTAVATAVKAIPAVATKLFTSLPFSGKVATVAAAPLLVTSKKARETVVNAPSKLPSLYTDVGNFIDNPSVSAGKDLVTKHPVASVTAGVVSSIGVVKAAPILFNAFSNLSLRDAVKDSIGDTSSKLSSGDFNALVNPTIEKSKDEIKADKKVALETLDQQKDLINLQSKAAQQLVESQTKAQIQILEAQTKQAKELAPIMQSQPIATVPISTPNTGTVAKASPKKKKKKKAKKKPKKKAKKKKKAKTIKKRKKKKKKR
jgi:hypothetical protein